MDYFSEKLLNCLKRTKDSFENQAKELLREELEKCMNMLLRSELSAFLEYDKYERNSACGNHRNGSYQRDLKTSFGNITISIPRDRLSEFKTKLLTPYKRRTDSFEDMILEIARSGLSHETTVKIIKSLYGTSYSANSITNITECFEEEIKAFKERKLDSRYFAIYLDGTYIPIRRKTIEKECVIVALGIRNDGSKEVLGYLIRPIESLSAYEELLSDLKSRGLESNGLFISDGFIGLSDLTKRLFPESRFQRCLVHALRNMNSKVRPKDRGEISEDFRIIRNSISKEEAKERYKEFSLKWDKKYKALKLWSLNQDELFAFMDHPLEIRKYLYSTNPIESLNKEIKRRLKTRIVSTENSLEQDLICVFGNYNATSRKIQNYDLIKLIEWG